MNYIIFISRKCKMELNIVLIFFLKFVLDKYLQILKCL